MHNSECEDGKYFEYYLLHEEQPKNDYLHMMMHKRVLFCFGSLREEILLVQYKYMHDQKCCNMYIRI